MERKFKFVGDPMDYKSFEYGNEYLGSYKVCLDSKDVFSLSKSYPEDWEDITPIISFKAETLNNRIPNEDQQQVQ